VITGVVSDNIKKLITISRLDTVLTIIPTKQEAIDYVLMDEIAREIDSDNITSLIAEKVPKFG